MPYFTKEEAKLLNEMYNKDGSLTPVGEKVMAIGAKVDIARKAKATHNPIMSGLLNAKSKAGIS